MTNEEMAREIGSRIKHELDQSLMTQKELSEDTGIVASTICRYILGESMPSLRNLINIAYSLDCSIGELVPEYERVD